MAKSVSLAGSQLCAGACGKIVPILCLFTLEMQKQGEGRRASGEETLVEVCGPCIHKASKGEKRGPGLHLRLRQFMEQFRMDWNLKLNLI